MASPFPSPKFVHRVTGRGVKTPKALFICGCGKEFVCAENNVRTFHTKSCGCLKSALKLDSTQTEYAIQIVRKYSMTHLTKEVAAIAGISTHTVNRIRKRLKIPHLSSPQARALFSEKYGVSQRRIQIPKWVPEGLVDDYRKLVSRRGQYEAADWAREEKKRLASGF